MVASEFGINGGWAGLRTTKNIVNIFSDPSGNTDDTTGNITQSQLTLPFILDERARELTWEGHRRTDLIRFDKFTGDDYVWPWKGGVKEGTGVEDYRILFPIPNTDLTANPTLEQNPGYLR